MALKQMFAGIQVSCWFCFKGWWSKGGKFLFVLVLKKTNMGPTPINTAKWN